MLYRIKNIGLTPYSEALAIQQEVHEGILDGAEDTLILCEHPHVYTFGKSADRNNLLKSLRLTEVEILRITALGNWLATQSCTYASTE